MEPLSVQWNKIINSTWHTIYKSNDKDLFRGYIKANRESRQLSQWSAIVPSYSTWTRTSWYTFKNQFRVTHTLFKVEAKQLGCCKGNLGVAWTHVSHQSLTALVQWYLGRMWWKWPQNWCSNTEMGALFGQIVKNGFYAHVWSLCGCQHYMHYTLLDRVYCHFDYRLCSDDTTVQYNTRIGYGANPRNK